MGVRTHVVEFAPRLMPVQIDDGGGRALRRRIEELGVGVRVGHATAEVLARPEGGVRALRFAGDDHDDLEIDLSSALQLVQKGNVLAHVLQTAARRAPPFVGQDPHDAMPLQNRLNSALAKAEDLAAAFREEPVWVQG